MAKPRTLIVLLASCLLLLASTSVLLQQYDSGVMIATWIIQLRFNSKWLHESRPHSVEQAELLLGVGKADITGPVVEINLMGYADTSQIGTGLRQRIYSRAFIVGEKDVLENRIVYLVLDTQSGDTAIRKGILDGLSNLGPEYAIYGPHNVAVTGTHQHSGPAAWLNYLLPQITSKGFDKQSYMAIVNGAVLSIQRAHQQIALGRLSTGSRRIEDANINRSLYAYLNNPAAERSKYGNDTVDKDLTLLRFTRSNDSQDIGVLTWFPVHGTSLLENNTLITGDNKGVAAYLFEQALAQNGNINFVAGFSQANVGDTSPNVMGAFCEDGTNVECRLQDSTCKGRNEPCHGRGPFFGLNDGGTKSCFEIGKRQFDGAKALYDEMVMGSAGKNIVDATVRSYHTFVDFSHHEFQHPNGTLVTTCPGALGYGFAAGTTDGPGKFDFKQNSSGSPNASPLWTVVRDLIHTPSEEQIQCQGLKPILLDAGETKKPYEWAPNILDVQAMRVGELFMVIAPGEATTMSGRRWREAVHAQVVQDQMLNAGLEPIVVLGGPANTYGHYIATEEEYAVQRYEGASTLHGPHSLNAHINLTLMNLQYLASSSSGFPAPGPQPQINTNRSLSFITGVILDSAGIGKKFGQVLADVKPAYNRGDVVSARFVGANPRNNLRLEQTFAAVETLLASSAEDDDLKPRNEQWMQVRDDADWELIYNWKRTSEILGTSNVIINWETGPTTPPGKYRMRYYGDAKSIGGKIEAFAGLSSVFEIV